MTILRFFFGHGWWALWHIAFYLILLISVVLILAMFAQDLKKPGEKPDLPSPASIMVLMIALGLGLVTLVDGMLYARVVAGTWWVKAPAVIGASAAIIVAMGIINMQLATVQSPMSFWLNLIASAAMILANLVLLHFAETRPAEAIRPAHAILAAGMTIAPALLAMAAGIVTAPPTEQQSPPPQASE